MSLYICDIRIDPHVCCAEDGFWTKGCCYKKSAISFKFDKIKLCNAHLKRVATFHIIRCYGIVVCRAEEYWVLAFFQISEPVEVVVLPAEELVVDFIASSKLPTPIN